MRLLRQLTWGVAMASLCWATSAVMAQQCPPPAPGTAYVCPGNPSCPTPTVAARENIIDNAMVGEVLVGETVVMRLRAPLAGYSPVARATMVAQRVCAQLDQGKNWGDVRLDCAYGQPALFMGDMLIVMIDERDAIINNTTAMALGATWGQRMQVAMQSSVCPRVAGEMMTLPPLTGPATCPAR